MDSFGFRWGSWPVYCFSGPLRRGEEERETERGRIILNAQRSACTWHFSEWLWLLRVILVNLMTGGQLWERTQPPFLSFCPKKHLQLLEESMNHNVCCPLIVLSSTLHTGTNQLPWMKHDLQAEFWKAPEVFRKGWGLGSFPMICSTFQMCLQMQTRQPRGQTTHILNWFSLTTFGLLVLGTCFQGNGGWKHGCATPAASSMQIVSSHGEPAALVLGDGAGRWQVHAVVGFWAGGAGTVNLVTHHACLHNCQSCRPGQGWCACDVSCADYFGILVCLPLLLTQK